MRIISRFFCAIVTPLIAVAISIMGLEFLLRAVDPWGARYFENMQQMWSVTLPDPTGYVFVEGEHPFGRSTFSIGADGLRRVPGRVPDRQRVTFVGDSVTFAQGVNDDAAWVSIVSGRLGLDAVNAGRSGYNIGNFSSLFADVRGCVVWLTIPNDTEAAISAERLKSKPDAPQHSYIWLYLWSSLPKPVTAFTDNTDAQFRAIAARPDTLILAFDDGAYGDVVRDRFGAVLIAPYTSTISRIDPHASAEGNRQIADAATPMIADWLEGRDCD